MEVKPILTLIKHVKEEEWIFDNYRNTQMLPIYTESGLTKKRDIINKGGKLDWTPFAPKELIQYFEQYIFPKINPLGRIMILKTKSGQKNTEHIDCSKEAFEIPQPKLRIVLQGNVDSLYFITADKKSLTPYGNGESFNGRPFIIDGRWPHGMHNHYHGTKYTLCLGAPWIGDGLSHFLKSVQPHQLIRHHFKLPQDYEKYFETSETRRIKLNN